MSRPVVGVLLAAGQGQRFGSGNKLLYRLSDGTPLAVAAARRLRAVIPESIAVVENAQGEVARVLAETGLRVVVNPRAREGMGTSIACGVAHSGDAAGWVIALADMPWVPESVIRDIVTALERGADIIAPVHAARRGHPVGFAAQHAQALMQLQGDEGASRLVLAHRDSLQLLAVEDPGVITDIDVPPDSA